MSSSTVTLETKTYVTSPSFYSLRAAAPLAWPLAAHPFPLAPLVHAPLAPLVAPLVAIPADVETKVSEPQVLSVVNEPKKVSVDTKVEENFPFTTTTTTTTTTEVTREVKAPQVTYTYSWKPLSN